jgi:predicted metal-dependent enzyme (double-stranded beta helix superfamily)
MSTSPHSNTATLRRFVSALTALVNRSQDEALLVREGSALLRELIARDDWLPEELTKPHPQYYQQHLLHCDPLERFSVVSFVWGPGQRTPVHDHTVWGLIGMLRGAEVGQHFRPGADGRLLPRGPEARLERGDIELVSPATGDVHQVANAYDDRTSISIHVYGANIGAVHRHVYTEDGQRKPFVSGYSNAWLPNLWDRSKELTQ